MGDDFDNLVVLQLIAGTNIALTPAGGRGAVRVDAASTGGRAMPDLVLDYGAVPGQYADTALANALAASGPFTVNGSFKLARTPRIKSAGTRIYGSGGWGATGPATFTCDDGVAGFLGEFMFDLTFGGGVLADSQSSEVHNVNVVAAGKTIAGTNGIESRRPMIIRGVTAQGFSRDGIALENNALGDQVTATFSAGSPNVTVTSGTCQVRHIGGYVTLAQASNTWPLPYGTTMLSRTDATHFVLSANATANGSFTVYLNGAYYGALNASASLNDEGRLEDWTTINNGRNGLGISTQGGGDNNAWTVIGGDTHNNGAWGVDDQSFLGNTHIGHHSATNGTGSYRGSGINGLNGAWVSCYSEGGEGAANIVQPQLVIGGDLANGNIGGSYDIRTLLFQNVYIKSTPVTTSVTVPVYPTTQVIGVDASGASGNVTCSISGARAGQRIRVVKLDSSANAVKDNNGNVLGQGGPFSQPVYASAQYRSTDIFFDGTNTFIIGTANV